MYHHSPLSHDRNEQAPESPFGEPETLQATISSLSAYSHNQTGNLSSAAEQPALLSSRFLGQPRLDFVCPGPNDTQPGGFTTANDPGFLSDRNLSSDEYTHVNQDSRNICLAGVGIECYCNKCSACSSSTSTNPIPEASKQFQRNSFGPASHQPSIRTDTFIEPSFPPLSRSFDFLTNAEDRHGHHQDIHPMYSPYPSMTIPSEFNTLVRRSSPDRGSFSHSQSGGHSQGSYRMTTSVESMNFHRQLQQPSSVPSQRSNKRRAVSNLDACSFIKIQDYLTMELKNGGRLSATRKQELARFLAISPHQLEKCIKARHEMLPILDALGIAADNHHLPMNHIAQWFINIQPRTSSLGRLRDSAYQSNETHLADDTVQPMKKRKLAGSSDNPTKVYQCTYFAPNGSHCVKENNNLTDWKRHEETHWPQRRWECLIHGTSPLMACHVCHGTIDLVEQEPTTWHVNCVGKTHRKGHFFPRKDKLWNHVITTHGCKANIDAWFQRITSDWKRQCGFCGERFTDWEARCEHVGREFVQGKRMFPDWKDPWRAPHDPPDMGGDDSDDDNEGDDKDADGDLDDKSEIGDEDGDDDPNNNHPQSPGGDRSNMYTTSQKHSKHSGTSHAYGQEKDCHLLDSTSNQNVPIMTQAQESQTHLPDLTVKRSSKNGQWTRLAESKGPGGSDDVFRSIKHLGSGSYGTVDAVTHLASGQLFARKTVWIPRRTSSVLAQAHREISALRSLKHVHIVSVVASYRWDNQLSILMSPVAECNLSEYMLQDASTLSRQNFNLSRWIGCLISAVSYMHSISCLHMDIKPSNILVSGDHIMLSDFGGAVFMNIYQVASADIACTVTPMYCAPELATSKKAYFIPAACDVYSLGCVLLEMATVIHRQRLSTFEIIRGYKTKSPTYHNNTENVKVWIDHLWSINDCLGVSRQPSLAIIRRMLDNNFRSRPSAQEVEDALITKHPKKDHTSHDNKYMVISDTNCYFGPLDIVRSWLEACRISHRHCSQPVSSFSPSRILNVGDNRSTRIYLEAPSTCRSKPYVALSHCWSAGHVLKTTIQTLEAMSDGISVASLSNTFSDAVRITRALGFNYLWIDSLCIVQDCPDEMATEISRMDKIYSHSSLTICIAGSGERREAKKPCIQDTKPSEMASMSQCTACNQDVHAFEPLVDDSPSSMLLESPWWNRAWILQERLLSRRILYYSRTKIAWECSSERSTLDSVSRIRNNLEDISTEKLESHNNVKSLPEISTSALSARFAKIWRDIVREYSRRLLSVPGDKLPALAGVASRMAQISHNSYVAGLWKENILHDILWCRDFATIPIVRPTYRAPTWSWASIDAPVVWSKSLTTLDMTEESEIIECQTTPLVGSSPFSRVLSGFLQIKGLLKKVTINKKRPEDILNSDNLQSFAFAHWDAVESETPEPQYPRKHIWCLQLLRGAGLLLRQKTSDLTKDFERVGVYWDLGTNRSGHSGAGHWEVGIVTIV